MISTQDFSEFKEWFMEVTKEEKLPIMMEDIRLEDWDKVKDRFSKIDKKHIKFVMYPDSYPLSNDSRKVVRFEEFSEFEQAERRTVSLSQSGVPGEFLTIDHGYRKVGVIVDVNQETKDFLKELKQDSEKPDNYTGPEI